MTPVRLFFLIFGFVVASATENGTVTTTASENLTKISIQTTSPTTSKDKGKDSPSAISSSTIAIINTTTQNINTTTPNITSTTSNMTSTQSTIKSSTTTNENSTMVSSSPKPIERTTTATTVKGTTGSQQASGNTIGIVILIVVIIIAAVLVIACYWARRKERRYSIDPNSRAEEANIPLSTMDPTEPHVDRVSQNGLQTFESTETATKEPQEPEEKSKGQEEQKSEAEKPIVESSAESAPPASTPSPDTSEDKPKEAVVEQSPSAPVEPSVDKKTDEGGLVSNETSVEPLKQTNENNSNNAELMARGLKSSNKFWDVPLDCPV